MLTLAISFLLSQGLGKTLQTIGLILAKPPEGFDSYPMPTNYAHRRGKPPRCTLIICPKSVAANWKIEINKHVNRRKPNKYLVVDMYFGTSSCDQPCMGILFSPLLSQALIAMKSFSRLIQV